MVDNGDNEQYTYFDAFLKFDTQSTFPLASHVILVLIRSKFSKFLRRISLDR